MAIPETTDIGTVLSDAIHGGYVAHLSGDTYTIASPIVVHVTSTIQGALGIDGGGATLVSEVTDGSPLIQIVVDPGVDFRYLTLSNFNIQGNGYEGSGIQLLADGNDRWAYNWTIDNVTVDGVGGWGLDMQGSVFEGLIIDSWMQDNGLGGAYFAHSPYGGVASALRWLGGGALDNGGPGILLDRGVRDLGVDGATFSGNDSFGINAPSGITAVSDSIFYDNLNSGVAFQNYGNFGGNHFSTDGSQPFGIRGYLAGQAALVGNGGAEPTLADLQGNGGLFLMDNGDPITTGPQLTPNVGAGNLAHVSVETAGVAVPDLAPVTAGGASVVADGAATSALEAVLEAAIAGGTVAHLTDDTYTIDAPIVIEVTESTDGPVGIDLGGAKILSQITDGSPVIEIVVGRGVNVDQLSLSNFSILGNGGEGAGIRIVADGADRAVHDWRITSVNVEHVGGIGLDVVGNVSEGTVLNSWMHGNDQGGARFSGSPGGGMPEDVEWVAGGMRKNGVAGLILDNGAHDISVSGAYFVDNDGPGIVATSGIALVEASGFENNLGTGAVVQGSATFSADTFATYGRQTTGIGGYLEGDDRVMLTGIGSEYYGPGANPTVMANLQGEGTLAIAGGGDVVAGPDVTVAGMLDVDLGYLLS
jgi:hypothetical protein